MRSWNYRVFHTRYGGVYGAVDSFTIREVSYTLATGGVRGITPAAFGAHAYSLEDLESTLAHMRLAFGKPTLTPQDIPGYTYEDGELPLEPPIVDAEMETKEERLTRKDVVKDGRDRWREDEHHR